jgi:hypothetical protein
MRQNVYCIHECLRGVDEDLRPCKAVLSIISDWILMEYGADFQDNDELTEYVLMKLSCEFETHCA